MCYPAVEALCWTKEIIFPVLDGTEQFGAFAAFSLKAQSGRKRL